MPSFLRKRMKALAVVAFFVSAIAVGIVLEHLKHYWPEPESQFAPAAEVVPDPVYVPFGGLNCDSMVYHYICTQGGRYAGDA